MVCLLTKREPACMLNDCVQGCEKQLENWLTHNIGIMIGIAIGVILVEVFTVQSHAYHSVFTLLCLCSTLTTPFSSDRQHLSYDGCLEVKGEIIRTVLCCIVYWKLCTVISTLRWAVLTVLWIGFCLTGPTSLCIDSFVYIFCVVLSYCMCCIIVTWWGGPGKIEA